MKQSKVNSRIISATSTMQFERELSMFIADKTSYSIQYKPLIVDRMLTYTALVLYQTIKGEENDE